MDDELRLYLASVLVDMENTERPFVPQYLVIIKGTDDGSLDLMITTEDIAGNIRTLLDTYDEHMRDISNPAKYICNVMVA